MTRTARAASTLTTALGLALAMQMAPASADDMSKMPAAGKDDPAHAMAQKKMEKCYGVNAVGKNDCSEGAHSCAGQADKARDPQSFVLLPAGACEKIAGGKLKSS